MTRNPSKTQTFFIVLSGIAATYVWVWLLTVWAICDTPLLKLGAGSEGGFFLVSLVSLLLFSFLTAALFTAGLYSFSSRCFNVAAIIFGVTFLLYLAGPALLSGVAISQLFSEPLLCFIAFFAACSFFAGRVSHP